MLGWKIFVRKYPVQDVENVRNRVNRQGDRYHAPRGAAAGKSGPSTSFTRKVPPSYGVLSASEGGVGVGAFRAVKVPGPVIEAWMSAMFSSLTSSVMPSGLSFSNSRISFSSFLITTGDTFSFDAYKGNQKSAHEKHEFDPLHQNTIHRSDAR